MAYFAAIGPEFAIPNHDGYRRVSHHYMRGEVEKSWQALLLKPFDPDFVLQWNISKDFKKLYLDYVPTAYLGMCFQDVNSLREVLKNVTHDIEKLKSSGENNWQNTQTLIHIKILEIEIRLFLAKINSNATSMQKSLSDLSRFVVNYNLTPKNSKYQLPNINYFRFLGLKARLENEISLLTNDPLLHFQALQHFEKTELYFQKFSYDRQVYYANIGTTPLVITRYSRAQNILNWRESIQRQIKLHPDWLRDVSEQLDQYEKRLQNTYQSPTTKTCQTLSDREISTLMLNKKVKLNCTSTAQVVYTNLTQKIQKFEQLGQEYSKILLFEDSPLLWARNQFIRYNIYHDFVDNNRSKLNTKRTLEFCLARRALENTLRVVPQTQHDKAILNWCQ